MTEHDIYCPNCDAVNSLTTAEYSDTIQYKGQALTIHGLQYSECSACGGDPVLTSQIRHNERLRSDATRAADGMLTGADIAKARQQLELTQAEAAVLFGGGGKAFSKYENGSVCQSAAMDKLIRLAAEVPQAEVWLRAQAGLPVRAVQPMTYAESKGKVIAVDFAHVGRVRAELTAANPAPYGSFEQVQQQWG